MSRRHERWPISWGKVNLISDRQLNGGYVFEYDLYVKNFFEKEYTMIKISKALEYVVIFDYSLVLIK